MHKKRALSGINPSSNKGLHLGNYLGAVKRFVAMQETYDGFFFVANLHSLNSIFNPSEASSNASDVFLEYLAFGIDPAKSTFFVESDIPEIPYLQTILNNCVTVSELSRMHGYKDKLAKDAAIDTINAGLFEYPVLMASDILIFNSDLVPVGDDQTQHVEICREIGKTFNNRYGSILKIPDLVVEKSTARIIGTDGVRKMSKSLGNVLPVFAPLDILKKQIRSIVTDPARIRPIDPGDPDKNICFSYLRSLEFPETQVLELEKRYRTGTVGDVEIKNILEEQFLKTFTPFRLKKDELQKDPTYIQKIRETGAQKAREVASSTLQNVKKAVGV